MENIMALPGFGKSDEETEATEGVVEAASPENASLLMCNNIARKSREAAEKANEEKS